MTRVSDPFHRHDRVIRRYTILDPIPLLDLFLSV